MPDIRREPISKRYAMYENNEIVTPYFDSVEELAKWLYVNKGTMTYEEWLKTVRIDTND